MRWVGLGFLIIAFLAFSGVLGEAFGFTGFLPVLWVSFGVLPAAIGLAVMRYRLFEIDRLISRTVSYALVVGLLAAVFAAVAIGQPRLLGIPVDSPLLVAGATLTVAASFNPLRRRVQGLVDRRFNRARYDAQQEVKQFSDRLRDDVRLDDVSSDLIDVAAKTMQPESAPSGSKRIAGDFSLIALRQSPQWNP